MKQFSERCLWLFLLIAYCSNCVNAGAQRKGKQVKGTTEQALVFRLEACLANEDPYCYISLFPDMDTFSKMVMAYTDTTSKEWRAMEAIQQQPTRMLQADSTFRTRLKDMFDATIAQGKEQGMHWNSIVPVRYELVKAGATRNAMYEKLAPERFTGYFFVQDAVSRKTFGFIVSEMLQIGGEWYGGYIGEIYEAGNRDEYEAQQGIAHKAKREGKEPQKKEADKEAEIPEEPDNSVQKMVAERKYYTGKFDNEIPVQLYVRSLKGICPEGICAWEAIYKFGDQDDYVLLTVTRDEDGDFIFTEVPPTGSMDLKFKDGKYTGNWTATDNQTGYDVRLTEAPASSKKIATLDEIFLDLKKNGPAKEVEE